VRLLPVAEYGIYVILVAGMELGIALAGLGLPWLAVRYLPEYRLHASGPALVGLCRQLLLWQAMALFVFFILLNTLLDTYLAWARLDGFLTSVQIYLMVLLIESLGRFLREALMGPLILQAEQQFCMVLRQLTFLALIAILDFTGYGTLIWVVWAELVVSVLSTLVAFILLWRYLNTLLRRVSQPGWFPPKLASQWRIAGRMYLAHLLTLTYSPQTFINIIQRSVGIETAAMFGFLGTLQGQISRYLPATLLTTLIRPKLVAGYVSGGGMNELSRNAKLAGKFSLFVLMPLVILAALVGDPLVTWLSGGKFMNSGWLLWGFMLVLIPYSQRQLIESVAVASGHTSLCTWAAGSGLIVLPLMLVMLQLGWSLWSAVIATGLGYIIFNFVVIAGVSKQTTYRVDRLGFLKLVVSALISYAVSLFLYSEVISIWFEPKLSIVFQCASALLSYLIFSWWLKPFKTDERARINALIGRQVFVW
jgi:O-antigen/teichoic acid export membrane protein